MSRSARGGDDYASWGLAGDLSAGRRTAAVYGGQKIVAARNLALFPPSGSVFTQESVFGISCVRSVP
ncbi:hypothetical protein JCGZ_22921 [Jatropha curcas]|uniref:Uncharacterized protein n=1 Tax=Jatropha curcas TaxID=180498 RepID=A0A067L7C6_JATCU|nr:hypothetical protein JCGZ_22921 [Jatropha curcas]